ncbi:hypothetical protein D910_06816 [Dendroctonus ponderosae]|uniref:C2H2-type domain-containing protein n=2 Tax=Dendroctonus ponderosae TaxID=77166 RepID=U4U6E4_DENPD|nr:hypothetical protein D910_06816 [Dendroctonus ponderosae]
MEREFKGNKCLQSGGGGKGVPLMQDSVQASQLFALPFGAQRLLEAEKKTEPKVLQCEKCSKVFSGLPGLEYHMKRKVCEHSRPPVPGTVAFDLFQGTFDQ